MISGIGCASRFPYYMNTFGFHTIHGRAPAIATGVKLANPELSVWVVTGDGDALSIGGNHLIHALRRNIGLKILMFNNRIYGLTKGQASPTSLAGQKTKSTPHGAADHPFNPLALALGAGASFVARAVDVMAPHLRSVLEAAAAHPGSAFIEILQNCVIFNDGTWDHWVERSQRDEHLLMLEPGRPLVFGAGGSRALVLEGGKPVIREIASETAASLPPWDPADEDGSAANTLARLEEREGFPMALGILRAVRRPAYEDVVHGQLEDVARRKGPGDLARLLAGSEPWSR